MSTVLAALDASPAARAVLETALGIGELTGTTVRAIHVQRDTAETPKVLAARSEVPLRLLTGPVESALLAAIAETDVVAAALGARATPGGRRPVGLTARHVLEQTNKPIVVVPPEAVGVPPRPIRRLLVPLEGTGTSSRPILETLFPLLDRDVELVVLHVFTEHTLPRILDHPIRDMDLLRGEFLARHCPDAASIELRTGPVGQRVAEVCGEQGSDLVVLSWSQDSSAGRAAVVREVVGSSAVPVLLLPVASANPGSLDRPRGQGQFTPPRR
jgi:nucleotide-binding universal stress UspA family protein